MACMAINYNVMVSLDISVGNPTWPNLDVLTYVRTRVCSSLRREYRSERDNGGISVLSSRYLPSFPRTKRSQQCELRARNCPSASALIECLFLSLRISYVVDMKNGENRGYKRGDGARERHNIYKSAGWKRKERKEGPSRRRRRLTILGERERERNTYETCILIITVIP